jgi:hypothetical protein
MRPEPQFFMMGAARPGEGELEVLDFDTHPKLNMRQMGDVLASALRKTEDSQAETVVLDLGVKYYNKPKVRIGGKAKVWPSIIGPYSSHDPIIVHQDVMAALNSGDLFGFQLKEVEMRTVLPRQLMLSRRPRYFALKTEKRIDYYLRVYERREDQYTFCYEARDFADPELAKMRSEYGRFEYRKIPMLESWDGSAFFHLGEREGFFGELGCSSEFLELAYKKQWTGFAFHPLDALSMSFHDFRSRPWPPSLWYPKGQPD